MAERGGRSAAAPVRQWALAVCLAAALGAVLLSTPPAFAAGGLTAPDAPAIGRLNHAGFRDRRHCTMVAIAPRAVLTARHCLGRTPASEFHLLFGYARMAFVAQGTVRDEHTIGPDLSVLCLNEDAPSTLPLAPPPDKGDDLTVMGYGRPKVHLAHETSCKSLGRRGAGLMLDCPLRQGASGAPVIDPSGGVVGIVSRSGPSGTLATLVPADAAKVCEAPAPS